MQSFKPVILFQEQISRFLSFLWTQCYMNFRLNFLYETVYFLIWPLHCHTALVQWVPFSDPIPKIQRELSAGAWVKNNSHRLNGCKNTFIETQVDKLISLRFETTGNDPFQIQCNPNSKHEHCRSQSPISSKRSSIMLSTNSTRKHAIPKERLFTDVGDTHKIFQLERCT